MLMLNVIGRPRTSRTTAARSPAASYRKYLAVHGDSFTKAEEAEHGGWIMVASILHTAAVVPGLEGERLVAQAAAFARDLLGAEAIQRGCALDPPSPAGADRTVDVFRLLAERIEDAGALDMAVGVLDDLAAACAMSDLEKWRVIAHHARLDWKMGNLDAATHRYETLERAGRLGNNAEMLVRAWNGFGALAQLRGNFPDVRKWGRQALDLAEQHAFGALAAVARNGLMVAAALAADFDEALVHGWAMFRAAAGVTDAEAEALVNLGQLLMDAGHTSGARSAFSCALVRNPPTRVGLPAGSGLVVASARLGEIESARTLSRKICVEARASGLPYQAAAALLECASALTMIGDDHLATDLRREARRIAQENGYHEIAFRAEADAIAKPKSVSPRPLGPAAKIVAQSVIDLDPGMLPHVSFAATHA